MKHKSYIVLAVFLIVAFAVAVNMPGFFSEPLVGGSCGTVSPAGRDECCAIRNADKAHIMCAGAWRYNTEKGECEYRCDSNLLEVSKAESQAIARDYVEGMPQYTEFSGSNLKLKETATLRCPGCFDFVYEFEIESDENPGSVEKFQVTVPVKGGVVEDVIFAEVSGQTQIEPEAGGKCGIESCHGLDITCGPNVPEICTAIYMLGDRCRQYVRCEVVDGECQLVESSEFNECKSCFEKCLNVNEGNPIGLSQCESECANFEKTDGRCSLEPESGSCKALFTKYYFDRVEGKCKSFTWGGCGGVVPFETLDECEKTCEKSIQLF